MKTFVAWLVMTAAACAGTIWPDSPITDSSRYYAKDAKVSKVDTAMVCVDSTNPAGRLYRMVLIPTVDTVMARKTVVRVGDVVALIPDNMLRSLRQFLKESMSQDQSEKPEVTVSLKWIVDGDRK